MAILNQSPPDRRPDETRTTRYQVTFHAGITPRPVTIGDCIIISGDVWRRCLLNS
jgi:hypothetical protein